MKERIVSWFANVTERDTYFWLGLMLVSAGLSRLFSAGVALAVCGAVLVGVSVFGVRATRGDS